MVAPPPLHHAADNTTGEEEEDWQLLGDVPFRKWACYPAPLPCWDSLALEDHIVVGAVNGGPLAVLRDEKKPVMMTGAERLGGFLRIYSSAGVLLGQAPWELGRKVVCMGWTEAEALIVILETGHVHWYTLLGQKMEEGGGSNSSSSSSNRGGGGQGEGITRLFAEGSPRRVIEAQVWSNGYVALADDYTLHIFDGSRANPDARLYRLPASGLSGQRSPTSMALLQPSLGGEEGGGNDGVGSSSSSSSSGVLQILLGTSDNSLLVVDGERGTSEVYSLQATLPGPVVKMSVSPDGRFVGCFAEGLLTVYATTNYNKVLDPFDAGTSQVPAAMGWCGKDALVLYWKVMGLLVVGPYGDFLHFPYAAEPLVLVPEVDCCRLWTGGRGGGCEILQRVPVATEAIHRIGSTEPAAMLYDAMEAFEKGDPKADENIRSILASTSSTSSTAGTGEGSSSSFPSSSSSSSSFVGGSSGGGGEKSQLHGAIHACLRAALAAWDGERQKKYLQAASYGKGFNDDEEQQQQQQGGREGGGEEGEADEFVSVCRKLRVLNHLRRPSVGMPLTAAQLEKGGREGGWGGLIDRLLLRRQYFLAIKVCDYLSLTQEKEKVLVQWACAFIQSRQALSRSDEELRDEIRRKFDSAFSSTPSSLPPSLSYAAIARTADQVRRRGLATMLLAYEPSPSSQVDLLLEMGEFNLALHRSLLSNDLDLAYRALLYLEAHKPSQETFLRLLSLHPSSLQLLKVYYRSRLTKEERTPWFNVSLARGDLMEAGTILAFQAYAQESLPRRIELIKEAARLYGHQGKQPLSSPAPSSSPSSSSSSSSSSTATTTAAAAAAALAASTASASFYHRATEEQAELLEVQSALEKRTGKNESVFVGLSVSETIYNLIVLASDTLPPSLTPSLLLAEAGRVAKKFKVPEKRFWHLKINALAASGQFENLKAFSNEKKSPVGYKPFAQACIKHKQPSGVVEGYIDRVALQEDRFDLYVEVRLWQKAAETAFRLKDPLRLRQVQANCMMPGLQRSVEELLAKLG